MVSHSIVTVIASGFFLEELMEHICSCIENISFILFLEFIIFEIIFIFQKNVVSYWYWFFLGWEIDFPIRFCFGLKDCREYNHNHTQVASPLLMSPVERCPGSRKGSLPGKLQIISICHEIPSSSPVRPRAHCGNLLSLPVSPSPYCFHTGEGRHRPGIIPSGP
jgi:hypothetical protein